MPFRSYFPLLRQLHGRYYGARPRSPRAEAGPLKGSLCRFDSDRGYCWATSPSSQLINAVPAETADHKINQTGSADFVFLYTSELKMNINPDILLSVRATAVLTKHAAISE